MPRDDDLRQHIAQQLSSFEPREATGNPLREAAVCVVIAHRADEPVVLMEKRAPSLRAHAGQFALPGGRIDAGTAARLVESLGSDARAVAAAIRQLLDDSDDRVITEAAVRRYFTGRADVTSFTVADHVMAGRRNEALGALRWALDTGVAPVLVTSALANALRQQGRYTDLPELPPEFGEYARRLTTG